MFSTKIIIETEAENKQVVLLVLSELKGKCSISRVDDSKGCKIIVDFYQKNDVCDFVKQSLLTDLNLSLRIIHDGETHKELKKLLAEVQ